MIFAEKCFTPRLVEEGGGAVCCTESGVNGFRRRRFRQKFLDTAAGLKPAVRRKRPLYRSGIILDGEKERNMQRVADAFDIWNKLGNVNNAIFMSKLFF